MLLDRLGVIGRRALRVLHDVLHALERRAHQLFHQLGALLDGVFRGEDRLRHALEVIVRGKNLHLRAGILGLRNPVGHRRHRVGLAGGEELPHAGGTRGLRFDVALVQPRGREHAEERIEGGVLVGHRGDGAALEILRPVDSLAVVYHELHQRFAAEERHRLYRHALRARDDRRVADGAADRRVARADLHRHVDAALGGDEIHL